MTESTARRPTVFISWSGDASKQAANALKRWVEDVFQSVDAFISTEIPKGDVGDFHIVAELDRAVFGIVALTPTSLTSDWVFFEAGALMRQVSKAKVSPALVGLQPADVQRPLGLFQSTRPNSDDLMRLARDINAALPERVAEERLQRAFGMATSGLIKELEAASKEAADEATNAGISTARPQGEILHEIYTAIQSMRRAIDDLAASSSNDPAHVLQRLMRGETGMVAEINSMRRGFGAIPQQSGGTPLRELLDPGSRSHGADSSDA